MRAAIVAVAVACATSAAAEPLPSGAIGAAGGAISGTGADAKRVGFGYTFGGQASWQPMKTEQKIGYSLRWSLMFASLQQGSAAQIIDRLRTVQMDATLGIRFRPWVSPSRYLTVRVGGELFRSNQPVPPENRRAFVGAIGSVGYDQYFGRVLLSVDARFGPFGPGPNEAALIFGLSVAGP
jgi:hypothetical protein